MARVSELDLGSDGLAFDPATGDAFMLNDVGMSILQSLRERREEETAAMLTTSYHVSRNRRFACVDFYERLRMFGLVRVFMDQLFVGVSGINAIDNRDRNRRGEASGGHGTQADDCRVGLRCVDPASTNWVVDRSFLMPYPPGAARLSSNASCRSKPATGWITSFNGRELPVCIKYADRLRELGIRTFLPSLDQFRLRGKDKLHELGAD